MPANSAAPLTDEQLALRAAAGCLESFEELVRRYQVPLLHFNRRHTRSIEDAEDITQEAFVRAYQNIDRYQPQWRFSTWLFTIARRLAITHARRKQLATSDDGLEAVVDVSLEPAQLLATAESRTRLWDIARENLDDTKFTALWLFYGEEMPIVEIANVLERSRVAVKTMLCRARKKLILELVEEADTCAPAMRSRSAPAERKMVLAGGGGT